MKLSEFWARLTQFWVSDRGMTSFLVFLVIVAFILPPLVPMGLPGRLLMDIFVSLLIVSGAVSMGRKSWERVTMVGVTVAALLIRWLGWFFPLDESILWSAWSTLATLVVFSTLLLSQVLRDGPVTRRRIEGAIAVYLLLGITWAVAYELVALKFPGAFSGSLPAAAPGSVYSYFSFVTLTTLGYGDVTPVHPMARSLAVTESLTGQLYIAILLARLVSLQMHESRRDPNAPTARDDD